MTLPVPASSRAALVTGASSGIGEAIATELATRGFGVILVARNVDKLQALAERLAALGVRAEVLGADLSDRTVRAELVDRVRSLGLTVDILINNAGLSTFGPVAESDPSAEVNMIEVDVVAVSDLCARFVPAMVERGRGAILNVASTAAFQPLPGQAGYAAGKAFVLSYSRGLAGELHGTPVTVTVLCPGPVETGFGEAAGIDHGEATKAMPAFMWEDVHVVAKMAIDGLDRGKAVVIPGAANRVAAIAAYLTPKRFLVPILARAHPALRN